MVGQHQVCTVNAGLHATAGNGAESVDLHRGTVKPLRDGPRHRVIGARRQALGQQRQPLHIQPRRHRLEGHQPWLAFGQRARLVQRHAPDLARLLQEGTALDEDAAPRCRSQATDDGDGSGDHQRTRAGNHQQHERLVGRIQPWPAQQQRRQQCHGNCQREDGGCVDGCKAVHEALRRRTCALGFFHRVDDASERAVGGQSRDAEFKRGSLVDGAGVHLVARRLVDRDALASDRGLVDSAHARGDHTVQRHPLTGANAGDGAHLHGLCRRAQPAANGLLDLSLFWRQRQQALDGVAGPVHGPGLDKFGNGVERHHHRRLGPLANEERTGHGHGHQGVDVEPASEQRVQAFFVSVQAGQADGHHGQSHGCTAQGPAVRAEIRQRLCHDRQHDGGAQAPQAGP